MIRKIIIDTDGCSDDAFAILLAMLDKNIKVELITTVNGCVSAKQAATNVLATLELLDTYYPEVHIGSEYSILRNERHNIPSVHGKDGMANMFLKVKKHKVSSNKGVLQLLETLKNNKPNTIDIIALGPLTNIALAILLDKDTMKKARSIFAMGSSGLGLGNVTALAESNIWQDPIACQIVIDSKIPTTFVGWDACRGDSFFNEKEINDIYKANKLGKFSIECNELMIQLNVNRFNKRCIDIADVAAMEAYLNPKCIDTMDKYYCEVDTSGGVSDGAVLVDTLNVHNKKPNIYICSKLKSNIYKKDVIKRIKSF